MFDTPSIVVGLDIGTSKICATVGELNDSGGLNVIGLGQAKSRGVRKGEIVDLALTKEDIRDAVVEAEQMADVEIRSVYLGVTGSHVTCFNNRGFHSIASHDREITDEDVQDVLKNARAINLPAENRTVHVIRQHFAVDGQPHILNPVGMHGARVEVDVHVVHGHFNRLQNPIAAVRALQLDVDEVVFTGLASSLALLTSEQKEQGSIVIDIGSGTTEYVVYANGIIKHTGVLAVGGDHISNDLAFGLKLPLGRAEQLKIDQGSALVEDSAKGQIITIPNDLGLPEKTINIEHLRRIMAARIEEIFQLIAAELDSAGVLDQVREGVFICGGGARIPQIQRAASLVFGMNAYLGKANLMGGLKSALDQPEFACAIGLARFGSFELKKRGDDRRPLLGIRSTLSQLLRPLTRS